MNLPCSVPWVTRLEFGAQAQKFFADPAQQWRRRLERILRARRGHSRSAPEYGVEGGPTALREMLSHWPATAPTIARRLEEAIHRAEPRLTAEVRLPDLKEPHLNTDAVPLEVWIEVSGQSGGYLFQIELDGRGRIGIDFDKALQ